MENPNRVTFKEVVVAWKVTQPGGTVPIPNKGEPDIRVNSYLDLFEILLKAGYDKDEIKHPQNRAIVIHHSHNPNHRDHKKGKIWKDLAEEDYDSAIALHPDLAPRVEIVKFDRSRANYPTPEAREYQKNIAELKESIAQDEPAPEATKAQTPPKPKEYTDPYQVSADELEQFKKEMESTQPSKPKPKKNYVEPEYDPEMRKLLGYDDE